MKRFMNSNFILFFQNNLSHADIQTLTSLYDEFTEIVLTEKDNFKNFEAYRKALVYTLERLLTIKSVSREKTD